MELTHTATRPGRLSTFLKTEMHLSTGLTNRLKWAGKIFVNGQSRHNDYQVQPGDVISVTLDEPTPDYPPEPGALTILYEDDHLLAVDKPRGMLIHPSRSTNTGTLANRVLHYYRTTGQACAFHPVTRLDRDTYGVVLLAKNAHIHALLQENTSLQKTYHALVLGGPEADSGSIDAPIARRPLPSLLRFVDPSGKPSLTRYTVLSRQENTSLLALEPVTGRTHQLRVHCAYMGFPIVGDPQYGIPDPENPGQRLCARRITFRHPATGEKLTVTSQLPL